MEDEKERKTKGESKRKGGGRQEGTWFKWQGYIGMRSKECLGQGSGEKS